MLMRRPGRDADDGRESPLWVAEPDAEAQGAAAADPAAARAAVAAGEGRGSR